MQHPAADPASTETTDRFELRFRSLFDSGRALAFTCDAQGRRFYQHTVEALFSSWASDILGLSADCNPFTFYEKQGFVLLYPDLQAARFGLQQALSRVPALRKVEVRATAFSVKITWHGSNPRPGKVTVETFVESLSAPTLREFATESGQRCEACQRTEAGTELAEDGQGKTRMPTVLGDSEGKHRGRSGPGEQGRSRLQSSCHPIRHTTG